MPTPWTRNVFDMPEIRLHIGRFLSVKDLLVCTRVCKQWHADYIPYLWHTLNFSDKSMSRKLPDHVLEQLLYFPTYGHHIRDLVTPPGHLDLYYVAQSEAIHRLTSLTVLMKDQEPANSAAYGLVRRNMTTLENLFLYWIGFLNEEPMRLDEYRLVPGNLFTGGSCLQELSLRGANMTRDDFSVMLRSMPKLESLRLQQVFFTEDGTLDFFIHEGVRSFSGTFEQLWRRGPWSDEEPLLVHLPHVKEGTFWHWGTRTEISLETRKDGFQKYLPRLTNVDFDEMSSDDVCDMLDQCFPKGLEAVELPYDSDFAQTVQCLIKPLYCNTLKEIMLRNGDFVFDREDEDSDEDDGHEDGKEREFSYPLIEAKLVTQIVVHSFPNLTSLQIPMHEIEAKEFEVFTLWGCKKLEVLSIRFEGLNTRRLILQVIELFKQKRLIYLRLEDALSIQDRALESSPESVLSIQDKVARHLLQFKALRRVWLGSIIYDV